MPLAIEVINPLGNTRRITWDWTHLNCCLTAALQEGDPDCRILMGNRPISELPEKTIVDFSFIPVYYLKTECTLWTKGKIVLKQRHTFDISDDEVFVLRAGDTIRMWREHK